MGLEAQIHSDKCTRKFQEDFDKSENTQHHIQLHIHQYLYIMEENLIKHLSGALTNNRVWETSPTFQVYASTFVHRVVLGCVSAT